ncbi:unnamed protein product, partial [Mesorhabditis belari]|uniref:Uncharacterized protein n=1 Tax=Mesorhabditis belari TaxID=2138241 RepID=A0AAF3F3T5_9BILA
MEAGKWTNDLAALRRDLNRKRAILKVVIDGTKKIENTDLINNVFKLREDLRMDRPQFTVTLQQTLAMDENTCWIVEVTSLASDSRTISACLLPPQSTRWGIFDENLCPLQVIPANSTVVLVIAAKTMRIFEEEHVSIALDLQPVTQFDGLENKVCKTMMLKAPKAAKFYQLHQLDQYSLQEVSTLILVLSVTRFDQEIPEMSSNELNLAFNGKFSTVDYGPFKICTGLGEFSSIFLYSIPSRGYKICRLNTPNDELATGFLKLLKTKLI